MDKIIKAAVTKLRKHSTPAEKIIWNLVRDRRLDGKKFLRQHSLLFRYNGRVRFFIADFYCYQHKLILELDGRAHERQQDYDELRTYIINQLGIRVVRFKNEEVESNTAGVVNKIRKYLMPTHHSGLGQLTPG